MPKTLISDAIKNVYQKIVFYLNSDNKLYKSTEDGNNNDTEISTIANSLTFSSANTFSNTVNHNGATVLNGIVSGAFVKDEDNMSSNSATAISTQQSIKAYADTKHALTTVGIADNNLVEMDDADAADNDYAKFTANGLEGRSYAELKSDVGLSNVSNDAQLPLTGGLLTGGGHINQPVNAVSDTNLTNKSYVDTAILAHDYVVTTIVSIGGSNNAVTVTGQDTKWALVHMCSDDSTQAMLVHINFESGALTRNVLTSTSMAYDSRTGVTATFSGLAAGHKIRWARIAGNSTITIAAAEV